VPNLVTGGTSGVVASCSKFSLGVICKYGTKDRNWDSMGLDPACANGARIFSNIAKLPSDGSAPYALMLFAGMLPWSLFSVSLGRGIK
jgi:hypothetical protein